MYMYIYAYYDMLCYTWMDLQSHHTIDKITKLIEKIRTAWIQHVPIFIDLYFPCIHFIVDIFHVGIRG